MLQWKKKFQKSPSQMKPISIKVFSIPTDITIAKFNIKNPAFKTCQ